MTNIVTFIPRTVRANGGGALRPQAPAAVVIFPGVRYERAASTPVDRQARPPSPVAREPSPPKTS